MRFIFKKSSQARQVLVCLTFVIFSMLILFGRTASAQVIFPNYALLMGGGAAAVALAHNFDKEAQKYFNGQGRIGGFTWAGNKILGSSVPALALGVGFVGAGYFLEKPYETRMGIAQIESLLATWATVSLIKSLSDRERPNGQDHYSFPSAHTAYAFSVATVFNEFYGWKFGVPAYVLAALTATGRMQDNQHWLSDTVGGAAIAVVIATTFSRWNLKSYEAEEKSKLLPEVKPSMSTEGLGVSLTWKF